MRLTVPVVCDFRTAGTGFGLSTSVPKPFTLPMEFYNSIEIYEVGTERQVGIPMQCALDQWGDGGFAIDPGRHDYIPLFDRKTVLIDNGHGERIPVDLTVSIWVEQHFFVGRLPLEQVSGFKDELNDTLITNAFTTGIFDPNDVWQNWQRIDNLEKVLQRPVMVLRGLVGYDAEDGT